VVGRPSSAVVIGYGNDLRGDDAAGLHVAAAVEGWRVDGLRVLATRQLTPELAETLAAAQLAIFVDARPVSQTASGNGDAPGVEILRLTPDASAGPIGHTSDPRRLLALAQALYGAHPQAWLVAVPAVTFELGDALSPTAARGIAAALQEIDRLIRRSKPCTKSD
jgi:hydrogenase maturation protease